VVGARPNFVKAAAVTRVLHANGALQILVHTGQHFDDSMSQAFFRELNIPNPDYNLGVGLNGPAGQLARTMLALEPVLLERKPNLVIVYGDVNSTLAGALTAAKLNIPVAHIEAGLRSFDRSMPEETNRVLTDHVSEYCFTHCANASKNLVQEGIAPEKIHLVGNVMIDTLMRFLPKRALAAGRPYILVTLHRPSNVDDPEFMKQFLQGLVRLTPKADVLFPVHPRTRERIGPEHAFWVRFYEPMPYATFLAAERDAALVITDSGGVQEETTYLRVPCITVRENTERPVTIQNGTNWLVGRDIAEMLKMADLALSGNWTKGEKIPLWDGHAAERIAEILMPTPATLDASDN
jgi:UDP-N-acetylglucosamine 2-epimerase (non-hydrolysing)